MNLEDILRLRRQWQGETVTVGYASRPDTSDGSPQTQWPTATPAVRKLAWDFARRERLSITHHVTTPASKPEAYYEIPAPHVLLIHASPCALQASDRRAQP